MFKKYKSKKAFTLVEFLTAALIVAVLAAIATPIFRKAILKARAAEAVNLLTQVRTKQYQNYARNKAYFMDFGNMAGKLTNSDEITDANNSSKMRIGDYEIELVGDSDCAIAHYKPNGATEAEFSFSISYLKNGLGCNGSICKGFGDVIGSVDDVCASLEQADYSCSNNFDPASCSFPKVIGIDGCSCVCSDSRRTECQGIEGAIWNEESCECTVPDCIQPASPDPGNDSFWWDEEGCTWRCALTLNACGERETYNENTCSCNCTYGRDSNGHCSCPGDQIWDGQTCRTCEYNFYTVSDDVNACCTDERPIYNGIECIPCPAKSHWNPETRICECANVVNGVCECPTETPMWSGTECVACAYQFYIPVGDIGVCCTAATPVASGNSCVACPAYSTFDLTEKKCVCNEGHIPAYDGNGVLTSCGCPAGTSTGYIGSVVVGACKCPANTNTTQTGGAVGETNCHCPEGMHWETNSNGINGGYCACDDGNTRFGAAQNSYGSNSNYYRRYGRACCPPGTAGFRFNTYNYPNNRNEDKTSGYYGATVEGTSYITGYCWCPTEAGPNTSESYQGGVANETCNCKNGMIWNGSACECPAGTATGYVGGYVAEGSLCRCPANTSPDNTGGSSVHEDCRCPEGMHWETNSNGINGGYCACDDGNTRFGAAQNSYGSNSNYYRRYGRACCPPGTAGFRFNTYNYPNNRNEDKTSGYYGATVEGTSYITGYCWCPTEAGPNTSESYQGGVANETCNCKNGMIWNGSACECPAGTATGYVGGYVAEGSLCRCPANTSPDNTGGSSVHEDCRCPEGMHWETNSNGINGGYCACDDGNTRFGAAQNSYGSNSNYYRRYGRACCPPGTAGFRFNTYNYPNNRNEDKTSGYYGATVEGTSYITGYCWCPTEAGPKDNANYQGGEVNASCNCKNGMIWNGSACECPAGTATGYVGGYVAEGSLCRCPANTSPDNTGGSSVHEDCRCPEGMHWETNSNGINGGYCACDDGNTRFGAAQNSYGSNSNYYRRYGRACCPPGTAGFRFNTYNYPNNRNEDKTSGYYGATVEGTSYITGYCWCPTEAGPKDNANYQGGEVNASCNCKNGMIWNGSACVCPTGTATGYVGGYIAEGSLCRCPANTSPDNTGGVATHENCRCPEGMHWETNSNGINGGYCACDDGNTRFGAAQNSYGSNSNYYRRYGRACCPPGTAGFRFNTYNYPNNRNEDKTSGYYGATVEGTSYITGYCWCPTGTGPRSSDSYQGTVINATCACPTGTVWYDSTNTCRKCPPGSTWDEHCGTCLCDQTDGYSTWGPYDQTNGCTQKACKGVGYFDTNTCSCGCLISDTEYDSDLECCRCPAQAGMNHDANHDINGCYIGS